MRLSDIQDQINALPIYGGTIELPAEQIDGGNGEEVVITKSNVRILGRGMNMSDASEANTAQAYRAPTQIKYTGSGVAIQIGTATQTTPVYGTELHDFSVRGTSSGTAGICVEGNTSTGVLSGRVLIENVDARDFTAANACGFDLHYGIGVTLRRPHAFHNNYGIRVRWGNSTTIEDCTVRHNGHGIHAKAFRRLSIGGVIESNDGPGVVLSMEDLCEDLQFSNVWFENNNVVASSDPHANNAIFICSAVSGAELNLFGLHGVIFNGGPGGDIWYDPLVVHHIVTGPGRIRWGSGGYYPP